MENQKLDSHTEKIEEFEVVQPGVWKPQAGESLTGILIQKKENVGDNNSMAYMIENEQGQHFVWGSTILDSRMELVNVGDKVRITYNGKGTNKKGKPVNLYIVERAKVD